MADPKILGVEERAAMTRGESTTAIYNAVTKIISDQHSNRGALIDLGCGTAVIWSRVGQLFDVYIGVDIVRHDGFSPMLKFVQFDLERGKAPLPDESADVVTAIEVIEHVENPRAFFREMVRLVKPSGLVIVSTPNQKSLLSIASLLIRGHFDAFQVRPGNYPAHITALLDIDLERIATECGLVDLRISYSNDGRVPLIHRYWPGWCGGRLFSDTIVLFCRKKPMIPVTSEH